MQVRLIDADALREVLETAVQVNPITQRYNKEDVIRAIMEAPTIALGTDSIMIKWTPDIDKLARDVAFRGLNEFSFLGKSIREWVEIILEQPSWISVKERLPERYERILTYDKYSGVKENWLLRSNPCVSWSYGFHVTHWMPLPEPPKEVKQND